MKLTLGEVARQLGAEIAENAGKSTEGWSIDSRTIQPGDVFFALRGSSFDGHEFVAAAFEKGAAAAIVDHAYDGLTQQKSGCLLRTKDTHLALQQLAAYARRRWNGEVIGVTGSAGKTTTKDIAAALLNVKMKTAKTIGNLNNHVGLPLSLLRMDESSSAAVLEMGMNHAGEIRELAAIAKPRVGIVTNVGFAHVEYFSSIDGVAMAKRELIDGLPEDGIAILNADDERVAGFAQSARCQAVTFGFSTSAKVRAEDFSANDEGMEFRVGGTCFSSHLNGHHNALNLLAGIATAQAFGIELEQLVKPVRTFLPGQMRGERSTYKGIVIWNDCYNSNPEAARAMLEVLRNTAARRRIAVLGEMRELGQQSKELHREVGRHAAKLGIDVLIGVAGDANQMTAAAQESGLQQVAFCEDAAEAGELTREIAVAGDAILFKGSRSVGMERALDAFVKDGEGVS